jgi:hypothetical protein
VFFEYAIDPAALSNWQSARYFLDAVGPWKGRLLAEYPKKWKRLVYQGLRCGDVEKLSVIERLKELDDRVFVQRAGALQYDGTKTWLDNAMAEHGREPFRALVASETRGRNFVLDAAQLDERNPLWRVEHGRLVPRSPEAMTQALGLLLRVSSHVAVVDPYFRADQVWKTAPLAAFSQLLQGRSATLQVHFAEEHVSCKFGMEQAERVLPSLLPEGVVVSLHCWKEKGGGKRFHNRFILTDVGGVQFGDGIEQGGPVQEDRVSILDEPSRRTLWEDFVGTSPAFESVGAVRDFEGQSRRPR